MKLDERKIPDRQNVFGIIENGTIIEGPWCPEGKRIGYNGPWYYKNIFDNEKEALLESSSILRQRVIELRKQANLMELQAITQEKKALET